MKTRKKETFDGIDREILRALKTRRPLVTRNIAKIVGLTPSAISPRLNHLKKEGILKISKIDTMRTFQRVFSGRVMKIRAPRSIYWDIDLKN